MKNPILFSSAGLLLLASVLGASATGLKLGSSAALTAFEPLQIDLVAAKDQKGVKGVTKPGKQPPQKPNAPKQPASPRPGGYEYNEG